MSVDTFPQRLGYVAQEPAVNIGDITIDAHNPNQDTTVTIINSDPTYKANLVVEGIVTSAEGDGSFVEIAGDTMTGPLIIDPEEDTALTVRKDISLKASQKLYFDGI